MSHPKIIWLFTLGLFIMSGCGHDPKDDPEPERLVMVYFSARPLSGSLLKSTASPDEVEINKIILYGVDEHGAVVQTIRKLVESDPDPIPLSLSLNVETLYAIANADVNIEWATPTTVADLMNMTVNFSEAPQPPFLMSGIATVDGGGSVNIELVRAIAKIDIFGLDTVEDFQIESITVKNTAAKGYVFGSTESISIPTGITDYVFPYAGEEVFSIYVAENSEGCYPQFEVKFQDNDETYPFTLKSTGNEFDIVRNTCYQVSISFESEY